MKQHRSIPGIFMLLLSVPLILTSCAGDEKPVKAGSTGKPSEILMVAEKALWKSSAGDSVRSYFAGPALGLPQPEPLYKLAQVEEDEFNRLLQSHRNIFIMEIDSSFKEPLVEIRADIWAAPQRVVKITAPSIETLKSSFSEKKTEILNLFDNAEVERLQKLYSRSINLKAYELIQKKFNLSMKVPADYYVAVNKENFLWLRREANRLSQGLIIYTYPYTDTIAFNPRKIQSIRNQFTELYVPGPSDSSYMVIADEFISPLSRTLSLKNELAIEMRGLWEVRKDFMGGPFISYTFVDKKNNMVVTLDGYVYAPNEEKRDLVKQVQSILLSYEFIDK
ncbi:MAG: DUF4837 family protein [Bacteroidales bacterium]|nr:DUF4837 family protein [Bacteroidales bacterium]